MPSPADKFYLSTSTDTVEKNTEDVSISVASVTHYQSYFGYKNGDLNFCEQQAVIRASGYYTIQWVLELYIKTYLSRRRFLWHCVKKICLLGSSSDCHILLKKPFSSKGLKHFQSTQISLVTCDVQLKTFSALSVIPSFYAFGFPSLHIRSPL